MSMFTDAREIGEQLARQISDVDDELRDIINSMESDISDLESWNEDPAELPIEDFAKDFREYVTKLREIRVKLY